MNAATQNSQKEVNNQIDNQNQCSVALKGPFFTGSWSFMKSSARHKQQSVDNNQLKCCFDQQTKLKQRILLIKQKMMQRHTFKLLVRLLYE